MKLLLVSYLFFFNCSHCPFIRQFTINNCLKQPCKTNIGQHPQTYNDFSEYFFHNHEKHKNTDNIDIYSLVENTGVFI